MTVFESGWEEPTTVRREFVLPAFLDLGIAECAQERHVAPAKVISELVEDGLAALEANQRVNGLRPNRGTTVVRSIFWSVSLDQAIEQSAEALQESSDELIAAFVETGLQDRVDLDALATEAAELLGHSQVTAG